jgi:hypothetical protein
MLCWVICNRTPPAHLCAGIDASWCYPYPFDSALCQYLFPPCSCLVHAECPIKFLISPHPMRSSVCSRYSPCYVVQPGYSTRGQGNAQRAPGPAFVSFNFPEAVRSTRTSAVGLFDSGLAWPGNHGLGLFIWLRLWKSEPQSQARRKPKPGPDHGLEPWLGPKESQVD